MFSLKKSCLNSCLYALSAGMTALFSLSSLQAEQVIFTEINYNPSDGDPEYIEITNNTATPFDIGTWYFSDGIEFTFPDFNAGDTDAHILKHWERIVVTNVDEAAFRAAYPGTPAGVRIFGPYTGSLSNAGENLALSDKNGVVMAEIDYNDGGKWPAAADGSGHTITRINPNRARGEWRNWRASNSPGGTPGEDSGSPSAKFLSISEVHFDGEGHVDWIEIYSSHTNTIPVTAFSISADRKLETAVPLSGTIPSGGYVSFPVDFIPDENGDLDLFLATTVNGNVMDAVKLDRDRGEESFQRYPIDGREFFGGSGHTQNAPNDPANRNEDIVINEIMFDAPSDQRNGEFIELYNRSGDAINLTGWKFTQGVNFDFPDNTIIGGNSYLVIAHDSDCLLEAHGAINVIGNWSGTLRDSGELIRLVDNNGNVADEVDYLPEGDWPNLADGDGSSMELRHPDMHNNVPTAWADSDEANKTSMETFSYTADFFRSPWLPLTSGQELHAHLVGDSHVILENISVKLNNSGSNLVQNPGVMSPTSSSASGWVCQGTHWQSFMDGGQLNLVSTGHGDNKANRGEVDMSAPVVGNSYTLSFDGRWVSGKSRVVIQTLDHGFGTSFLLPIPENLGTPGAPNSTLLPSAAPTVANVIHSPAVPKSGNPVTVSANITSSGPLDSVEVVYRLDNSSGNGAWLRKAMTDDGTGLYSTDITNYTNNGNLVQFYVEAVAAGQSTFQPIYGPDRPAMWIVDNRTMPSVLLRERFILSAYDRQALTTSVGGGPTFDYNFPRMSNQFFNATFIANESEIYYNAEIRKSGSPFTRSTNANIAHGKWKLPGDRLFRNRRRSVIDPSGTGNDDNTPRYYDDRIARYFLYQLGHPINEFEYVHSVINTDSFRLRENHEPISNDFLNRNFEDGTDGTLFRIDDEWRFTSDDGNARQSRNADWSYKDTDNPTSYQSEWIMRTRESDHDFSTYVEFVRTLDGNTFTEADLNRMANAKMLGLNAAVRGYDADWDTITVNRGKNAYMYRPKDGDGFMLIHWDGDRVFERTTQAILGGRPGVSKYFAQNHVRRYVNYYLTKLLDEHTRNSARTEAWMDAETAAVSGSGVVMPKSHYQNWFNVRENFSRNFVTSAVNNTNFVITTSNANTTDDVLMLEGTSPPTVLDLRVVGQPNAIVTWLDKTDWTIDGLILAEGSNTFDVEGVDHDGNVIESEQFTITKTNNGPPVVLVETDPKSLNVDIGQTLTLDASTSFDPEGDLLDFNWSVSPGYGANLVPTGGVAEATFDIPGIYLFTLTATAWMVANGFTDANAEYGNTGMSNLMAYALGRDLSDLVEPTVGVDGDSVSFTHRQRIPVSNVDYSVESSTNLIDWEPAGDLAPSGPATQNPDGTWTVNLLSNLTPVEQSTIYYRLIVKLPQ